MARKNWTVSTNFLSVSTTPASNSITMAVWFYPTTSVASTRNIFYINDDPAGNFWQLQVLVNSTCIFNHSNGVSNASSVSSNLLNFNAWNHICGVQNSTSNRVIWLNGVSSAANTTGRTSPSGNDCFYNLGNTSGGGNEVGFMDYPAYWDTNLSASQIAQLQTLFPSSVQASNLKAYWPLDGNSPEINLGSDGNNFNVTGTPTFDNTTHGRPSLSVGTSNLSKFIIYYNSMRG